VAHVGLAAKTVSPEIIAKKTINNSGDKSGCALDQNEKNSPRTGRGQMGDYKNETGT